MIPQIHSLLWRRFTLRHWHEAPGQSALLVLILALGVAVYFSIRLANRAATASFQHFTDLVAAESDWILQAPAGDLPVATLAELRERLGPESVHLVAVVESTATRPPNGEPETIGSRETFRILGIDLVGIQNLARQAADTNAAWFSPTSQKSPDSTDGADVFWQTLRDPASVFISTALARQRNLRSGDALPLVVNERIIPFRIAGVVPDPAGQPAAPATFLVMDLPALQFWTGRAHWLSRIELRLEPGPDLERRRADLRSRLEAWSRETPHAGSISAPPGNHTLNPEAPPRWRVLSPSDRREAGAMMTRAFRLNLTILSLLALLVGLYLMVQALDGAVVRRRAEIGTLRSLGVDPATLRQAWLIEAGAIGLLGGALGIALGWAGAQASVRVVGRTVNALYYATSADSAALSTPELLGALVLSVLAALLAGWWPARQAASIPPAQLLSRQAPSAPPSRTLQRPLLAWTLLGAGCLAAALPPVRFEGGIRFPAAGYLAALLWILGASLLGGRLLLACSRIFAPLGRYAVIARLGFSPLASPSGRHVLATAGLIGAVAMTAGMIILVGSFDQTMRGWIARTFQADLYVSSAGAQSASTDNRIAPETWRDLTQHPAVADANVLHGIEIHLPQGTTVLAAGDFGFLQRHVDLAWVQRPADVAAVLSPTQPPATSPAHALVSESFADRFQLGRGDSLDLPTPTGFQPLRIDGVFADYGNERGSIVIDRRLFTQWFQTEHGASVIATLRDPQQAEAVRSEWLARHPGLQILTNQHLRTEILRIFRQTFAITYALEVIGLAVAVLGLGMTLASVLIERRHEWTTLRALGMRPGELAAIAAVEGVAVAAAGLVAGLGVSIALGWLLIRVINKQTFGWTLEWAIPIAPLFLLSTLVLLSAAAVSFAVGRWGANLPADREE